MEGGIDQILFLLFFGSVRKRHEANRDRSVSLALAARSTRENRRSLAVKWVVGEEIAARCVRDRTMRTKQKIFIGHQFVSVSRRQPPPDPVFTDHFYHYHHNYRGYFSLFFSLSRLIARFDRMKREKGRWPIIVDARGYNNCEENRCKVRFLRVISLSFFFFRYLNDMFLNNGFKMYKERRGNIVETRVQD